MKWNLMLLFAGACYAADGDATTTADGEAATTGDATPETVENQENEEKKTKEWEPAGALTRPYQYIFSQGTMSFDGFDIVSPVNAKKNVGRLDGQTGWTGINQAGEKTMSYQIAFVIKSDTKLSSLFYPLGFQGRGVGQTTQLGWWIPSRGEGKPPEKWTMNLMDINIASTFTQSSIQYLQTLYNAGLYTKVGSRTDIPYKKKSVDDPNKHEQVWQFDPVGGKLASTTVTGDSVQPDSKYFVPIREVTQIAEDQLVIGIEGTSLKKLLPEIRWGTALPFYFQILDWEPAPISAWKLRQRNVVNLTFSEDPNACNLPAICFSEEIIEEDSAASIWMSAAASLTLLSMSLF